MTVAVGRLEVETPDHVVLRYTLAGVGNRGYAALVDFGIATLLLIGLEIAYQAIGSPGFFAVGGVMQLFLFLLVWSYFIGTEWLWNGQTLGKRMFGLRVITEDGSPARFVACFIRNLLRVVDFLPSGYCVGLIAIMVSKRSQRLGDMAAGTFVVRAPRPKLDWMSLRTIRQAGVAAPTAADGVRSLSGEAQRLVREFAARQATLKPADRTRVAAGIASGIRPRVTGIDIPDDVEYLRAVAAAIREAGERR